MLANVPVALVISVCWLGDHLKCRLGVKCKLLLNLLLTIYRANQQRLKIIRSKKGNNKRVVNTQNKNGNLSCSNEHCCGVFFVRILFQVHEYVQQCLAYSKKRPHLQDFPPNVPHLANFILFISLSVQIPPMSSPAHTAAFTYRLSMAPRQWLHLVRSQVRPGESSAERHFPASSPLPLAQAGPAPYCTVLKFTIG